MSGAGWSKAGLDRLHHVMAGHVARGSVPGIVTLLSRCGETHVDVIGMKTIGAEPMRRDTIFRIGSMTKPITAAAAMMLIEEGTLVLDEPVDRLLPELARRKVLRRIDAALDDTVPAKRAITVRDLLTLQMGFGLVKQPPTGRYPIQEAMAAAGVEPGQPSHAPNAWIEHLGRLPLIHQPGERWMYQSGLEVLGVLIARAAGQSLETFVRERIFAPLGMEDTGFNVPPEKIGRLATCYESDAATGGLALCDEAEGGRFARTPVFQSGASGLTSTVDDCLAFNRMMLDRGRHAGRQILSRHSVELMTTDHLTSEQKTASALFPGQWDNRGWGFGCGLRIDPACGDQATVATQFGCHGGFGTSAGVDTAQDVVAIMMTQRRWESARVPSIYRDFWAAVENAIAC